MLVLSTLSALVYIAAEETRPRGATPGPVAGLIFVFLFASVIVLWRSMNRHLRSARRNFDSDSGPDSPTS